MSAELIIMLFVTVALFLVSALLSPKPDIEDAKPAGLGDFQVPTADETRTVPIMWGTIDIKGPNVIWYGDLSTVKIKKKIKTGMFSSKKITVGYRYFIGVDIVLCYGPIDRLTRLEAGDKEASTTIIGPFGNAGLDYDISKENLFGGKEKGGGMVGTFKVYGGTPDQDINSYLINNGPADGDSTLQPAYVDVCHIVWQHGEIGERPNLGNWVFRITRFPTGLADNHGANSGDTIIRGDVENGDANPAEVMFEVLTNDVWGVGLDVSEIDIPTFVSAHAVLATEENGVSLLLNTFKSGEEIIKIILAQIDGLMFQNSDGVFSLKLVRADFVFSSLPIFNETNISKLEQFSRGGWSSTRNHMNIKYIDRNQDFINTGAMAQDTANFRTQGRHLRDDQTYPGVKHKSTARDIAARELRVAAFPLAKAKFKMNREAFFLAPGDVFRFQWDDLGIVDMVMRVGPIDLGTPIDGEIEIHAVQDIFGIGETVFAPSEDSGWVPITADAVAAVNEIVREVPFILRNQDTDTFPPSETGARLMSLVAAPNGVHVQFTQFVDDTQTGSFAEEGFGNSMTPFGSLQAAYTEATADVDATGFTLVGTSGMDTLTDDTSTNIQSGLNIALIEGSAVDGSLDEIFGWETFADNGDGTFTFTNIHRGLLDTHAQNHLIGANVYFLSDGNAISLEKSPTESVDIKHITETTQDVLAIADASTISITAIDRIARPHLQANLRVNGTRLLLVSDIGANDAAFTWEHRANDEILIRDANVGTPGSQDTDVEYLLNFYDNIGGGLLRQEIRDSPLGAGWTSFTYTRAQIKIDSGAPTGPFAVRADFRIRNKTSGLTALQRHMQVFTVTLL
jgi:hypothetical protein